MGFRKSHDGTRISVSARAVSSMLMRLLGVSTLVCFPRLVLGFGGPLLSALVCCSSTATTGAQPAAGGPQPPNHPGHAPEPCSWAGAVVPLAAVRPPVLPRRSAPVPRLVPEHVPWGVLGGARWDLPGVSALLIRVMVPYCAHRTGSSARRPFAIPSCARGPGLGLRACCWMGCWAGHRRRCRALFGLLVAQVRLHPPRRCRLQSGAPVCRRPDDCRPAPGVTAG
jgi:hypothetical protein